MFGMLEGILVCVPNLISKFSQMFECGSLHILDVSVAYTFPPSTLWYRGKTFTDKVRQPTLNLNLRTY